MTSMDDDVIPITTVSAYMYATEVLAQTDMMDCQCVFCKTAVTEPCLDCATKTEAASCPVVRGACGHTFHAHCITQYLSRGAANCMVCNNKWQEVQRYT